MLGLDMIVENTAWSHEEELKLLDALENHGLGNWKDIANEIDNKTAPEVKDKFINKFVNGIIGQITWNEVKHRRPVLRDLTEVDDGPLGTSINTILHPLDMCPQEAQQLYYYPLRDDFEIEYDNQAESLVSSLTPDSDGDDLDVALKCSQADMYNDQLRERKRRHRIVRDYELIASFFGRTEKVLKSSSKSERVLREKLFPFCQFHTCKEHEQFVTSLMRHFMLSRRLAELLRYRRFGLTRFDELLEFEKESISRHIPSQQLPAEMLLLGNKESRKRHKKRLLFSGKRVHQHQTPFRSALALNRFNIKKHQRYLKLKQKSLAKNGHLLNETQQNPAFGTLA